MIIPIKREWFRQPIFVGALVLLAVVQWLQAMQEIRETQFKVQVAREMQKLAVQLKPPNTPR
jgi:hypothetical protein